MLSLFIHAECRKHATPYHFVSRHTNNNIAVLTRLLHQETIASPTLHSYASFKMSERLPENCSPGQEDASDINICNWAPINNLPPNHPEHLQDTHGEIVAAKSQQPPAQVDHHYHHQGHHNTLPSISPYSTDVYDQQATSVAASVHTMTTHVRTDPAPVVIRLADSKNKQSSRQEHGHDQLSPRQAISALQASQPGSSGAEEVPPSVEDPPRISDPPTTALSQYDTMLTQVNGVVTPSKHASNANPIQPSGARSSTNVSSCPICRANYPRPQDVRAHFVACVGRNGNPRGLRWDHNSRNRRRGRHPPSERTRVMNQRLESVNGVVSASKLAPGMLPVAYRSQAKSGYSLSLACPVCGGLFGKLDHVRSHFPACVDKNGNPLGLRWDDGL